MFCRKLERSCREATGETKRRGRGLSERLYLSLMIIRVFLFPTMSKSWEFEGRKECGVNRRPRFRNEF